ncbi:unnamed protein product [Musa acuminata subsp. burmannicoides]
MIPSLEGHSSILSPLPPPLSSGVADIWRSYRGGMGTIGHDEVAPWETAEGRRKEERILVSVRVRPLNAKEIGRNDPSDWECRNNSTIVFKNAHSERTMYPTAYTFDKVFGCECDTRHVYDEGAKEVALSVVDGINASIFAYGQTSSGKTYTMTGITEYAMEDIYDYIKRHEERDFVLKFSAMEIYNELVRDLLSNDTSPLRLLDDAERGTVVEKLTEETLRDQWHLKELLCVCEAQRQVGETSLNEMSSRSHQILRLTIQSTAHEFTGRGSSSTLLAAVNFIDLAGSERASQSPSAGTRLKEGCHINRSLLTLGTVIRKLSKGRTGHIPYRDSKLTRILQPFLGGNGRTAIICTMSPARSHIEQSRNTLSFASCAKQIVTNAHVNVLMSDKALIKHLQKELARLENELRYRGAASITYHPDALSEKDAQIKKMEREIKELMQQRDLAQSRLELLLRPMADYQFSRQWEESSQSELSYLHSACEDALSISDVSGVTYQIPDFDSSMFGRPEEGNNYNISLELSDTMNPPSKHIPQQGRDEIIGAAYADSEDQCKEVQCIEIHALSTNRSDEFNLLLNDEDDSLLHLTDEKMLGDPTAESLGNAHWIPAKEQSMKIATRTTENFVKPRNDGLSSTLPSMQTLMNSRELGLTRSKSCNASMMSSSIVSWLQNVERDKSTQPDILKEFAEKPSEDQRRLENETLSIGESEDLEKSTSFEVLKTEDIKAVHEEVDTGAHDSYSGKIETEETTDQLTEDMIPETQATRLQTIEAVKTVEDAAMDALEFQREQQEIIQLWHACEVPLVHRSCFFLLFKGDPADSFYMEVERRRLSFLRNSFALGNVGGVAAEDGHIFSLASSSRYIRREREMLCREMHKKLSSAEREALYAKWGIALNSRQRSLQLAQLLWTQTDLQHVRESASLVAELIGFEEHGQAMKEMFGLSFTPQKSHKRSSSWWHGKFPLL